jgi:hypothetical protein
MIRKEKINKSEEIVNGKKTIPEKKTTTTTKKKKKKTLVELNEETIYWKTVARYAYYKGLIIQLKEPKA